MCRVVHVRVVDTKCFILDLFFSVGYCTHLECVHKRGCVAARERVGGVVCRLRSAAEMHTGGGGGGEGVREGGEG